MTAGVYNGTIEQGVTFRRTFEYYQADGETLVNLTGWTAKLKAVSGASTIFESGVTAGVTVSLGGALGTVVVELTDEATALLDFDRASWKLDLTDPAGNKYRLWKGTVTFDKDEAL